MPPVGCSELEPFKIAFILAYFNSSYFNRSIIDRVVSNVEPLIL